MGIAVQMISDAIDGLMDRIVLVSGDSDLEPAVEWIRKRHPAVKITVYIPQDPGDPKQRRNDTYRSMGVDAKPLPTTDIHRFQFPHSFPIKSILVAVAAWSDPGIEGKAVVHPSDKVRTVAASRRMEI